MNKFFKNLTKLFIHNNYMTIAISAILLIIGVYCLKNLDMEAYPDFTNPMVSVITQMPSKSAEDIERLATIPIEKELNGIPKEKKLYSTSIFGLSVIKVVFEEGLPSSLIRQQVLERIYMADEPPNVKLTLGPDASAISDIYRYSLQSDFL